MNSTVPMISAQTLNLGVDLEIVHASLWQAGANADQMGCWADDLGSVELLSLTLEKGASSVLQSQPEDFEKDLKAWINLRENPSGYFQNPLTSILPNGTDFEKHSIEDVKDKDRLRTAITSYCESRGNQPCQEYVNAIFEELYMNAMLDAPREAGGKKANKFVSFYLGCDERRIAIVCEDQYGSLKMTKLLARMKDVYERGAGDAIDLRGPGGAGLGCVIMLEKSSLLCIGVVPQQITTVAALVPRHTSFRKRTDQKKSIHLVEKVTDQSQLKKIKPA